MKTKADVVQRIGGLPRMREILFDFYDRLFDDTMVGFFFHGKDKALLVERQLQFTARAFGYPITYEGMTIPDAHAPLRILPGHFDRRHRILTQTLEAHHVVPEAREAWLALDRAFRRAVLRPGLSCQT